MYWVIPGTENWISTLIVFQGFSSAPNHYNVNNNQHFRTAYIYIYTSAKYFKGKCNNRNRLKNVDICTL